MRVRGNTLAGLARLLQSWLTTAVNTDGSRGSCQHECNCAYACSSSGSLGQHMCHSPSKIWTIHAHLLQIWLTMNSCTGISTAQLLEQLPAQMHAAAQAAWDSSRIKASQAHLLQSWLTKSSCTASTEGDWTAS
jgi:hypothetical protein